MDKEYIPRFSLGPARPINIDETCPRHPWNPVASFVQFKDKNLYCSDCQFAKDLGVKLKPVE